MNKTDLNEKGLFVYTGNPIIDNGMAVLAFLAGKDRFEDINCQGILNNLDAFFDTVKHQFDDTSASPSEKKHVKKKLDQHLKTIYGTGHYLHGINNYLTDGYEIVIKHKKGSPPDILTPGQIKNYKATYEFQPNKIIIRLKSNESKKEISGEYIQEQVKNNCSFKHSGIKVKAVGKKKVVTAREYFSSLKDEVEYVFKGCSAKLNKPEVKQTDNFCNFCGKPSALILSKDLFPMTPAVGMDNLGAVFMCSYCYVASLFFFFNLLNYKSDEKKAGIYFYYHFSNEKVMIAHAKKQYEELINSQASLPSKIGSRYRIVFSDVYDRIRTISEGSPPLLTIYFLLNHNQDLKVVYDVMTIPHGVLNFWLKLNSMDLAGEWGALYERISKHHAHQKFLDGQLTNFKYYFQDNKKKTLTYYLEEVALMDKDLIDVCEKLSDQLANYFQMIHNRNPTRRNNWTEEFYDFFSRKKPYELFNTLFSMNNDYFRWSNGENMISITSVNTLLDAREKKGMVNLLHGLIEYYILNNMTGEDKQNYFNYVNEKENR